MPPAAYGAAYRRDAGLLGLALAVALAICLWPFLFGNGSLVESAQIPSIYRYGAVPADAIHISWPVDSSAAYQTEPWLAIERRIVVDEHRLPLWDSYDGYGAPFAAAMQPQPFYPLTALLSLNPSPRAYSWWIAGRLFTCGWFAALFIRLFADRWAALAGGVACALTGYFFAYINMPEISVAVTLPMLLWATELVCRRRTGPRVVALAIAAALGYLGGMPEITFLLLCMTAAYSLIRLWESTSRLAVAGALIASQLLGAALAAVALLPFIEYVRASFNIHDGRIAQGLSMDPEWMHGVLFELAPRAFSGDGLRGFIGCAAAVLAMVALIVAVRRPSAQSRPIVLLLGFIAAYAFLKRFGNPLVNWTGSLPILRFVYLSKYLEPLLGIAVALLAGFGVAAVRSRRARSSELLAAFAAVLLLLTWVYDVTFPQIASTPLGSAYDESFAIALVAAPVTWLAAWCVSRRDGTPRFIATLVLVGSLAAEPLVSYIAPTFWFSATTQRVDPYVGAPYVDYLKSKLAISRGRVLGVRVLFPNWAGAFGISDPAALNALYPSGYLPFVSAFLGIDEANVVNGYDRFVAVDAARLTGELGRRWLRLSSIEYVLSDDSTSSRELRMAPDLLRLVFQAPGIEVYHVANAFPRLRLVHQIRTAASFDEARSIISATHFDLSREAVVIGRAPPLEAARDKEDVTVTGVRSDWLRADVNASAAALLLQNDTWFPGWTAYVDGRKVAILQADALFRGIPVPAGRHTVEIAYQPTSAYAGTAISIIALLICAALVVSGFAAKLTKPAPTV